jgi:hypothetical protein
LAGVEATRNLTPSPSRARSQSARALALGLDGVVRSAEAHAVVRIEGIAAVAALLDVVGEQAMARCCLLAALAILDPFAAIASARLHGLAKRLVARRMVERIGLLRLRLHRAAIAFRYERRKYLRASTH